MFIWDCMLWVFTGLNFGSLGLGYDFTGRSFTFPLGLSLHPRLNEYTYVSSLV